MSIAMKFILLVLAIITSVYPRLRLVVSATATAADDVDVVADNNSSFVVAGYLPDYRGYINVNSTAIHLTDLMLFSLTPESIFLRRYSDVNTLLTNQGGGCCLTSEHFDLTRKARSYKKKHQPTKNISILVTVGGGGRSNGFKELVTGGAKVQRQFIKSLVDLCRDEILDGIDFDFEGIQSLEEWKAYLTFLSVASTYLHRENLFITVALHPGQLLPTEVCQRVDRVHVMTYDMMPSPQPKNSDNKPNNHHASIHSAQAALENFIRNGCHPSKLVMGIPAYARHEKNMGLVRAYSEVVDDMLRDYDDNSADIKTTIQSIRSWDGYLFDSPDDVREKVNYATQMGLGGIFIWELGQDKQLAGIAEGGILLEEAAAAVANSLIISDDVPGDEL